MKRTLTLMLLILSAVTTFGQGTTPPAIQQSISPQIFRNGTTDPNLWFKVGANAWYQLPTFNYVSSLFGNYYSKTVTDSILNANYYSKSVSNGLYAPISGSANYIQNQNVSAQAGNAWIDGSLRLGSAPTNAGSLSVIKDLGEVSTNQVPFYIEATGKASIADNTKVFYSSLFRPKISGSNNKNWTGSIIGLFSEPTVLTGATGILSSVTGIATRANVNGMTIAENYGFFAGTPVGTGATVIGNAAYCAQNQTFGTNNTNFFIGANSAATIPTGNYNIFTDSPYDSYLGTGTTKIGANDGTGVNISNTIGIGATSSTLTTVLASRVVPEVGTLFYRDFYAMSGYAATTVATTSGVVGIASSPRLLATNTQNWTGSTGLLGASFNPQILTGTTGIITNVSSLSLGFSAAGMTTVNYRALNITNPGGSAPITNLASIKIENSTRGTNNVNILVGNQPTGNYNIYTASTYDNYFGTGKSTFDGNLTLTATPTTSAGTYDLLTRNASTGVVEKMSFNLPTNVTASGNGTATTISIPHGLSGITANSKVLYAPRNSVSAGILYYTIDATNVNLFYTVAPVTGTNNLNYTIQITP